MRTPDLDNFIANAVAYLEIGFILQRQGLGAPIHHICVL
jgi:hypothetical protein